MAILTEDLKLLRQIEDFGQEILKNHSTNEEFLTVSEADLARLRAWLQACAASQNTSVAKLAGLATLLSSQMTPRHFMNFLVPVERALSRDLKDEDFLVTDTDRSVSVDERRPVVFVLENLRSSFNVGSIFRLADGLAVKRICLCGYTPSPDLVRGGLGKTALGSEKSVPFKTYAHTRDALLELRAEGYHLVALETSEKATALFQTDLPDKTAFLVGNERFGVDHESLILCDKLVKLPLHGLKNSLNVATALTAAAFEWTRQYESHRTLPL